MDVPVNQNARRFARNPARSQGEALAIAQARPALEEGRFGPILEITRGLKRVEPELDVADGGLAAANIRLPPSVGGSKQVTEIAACLRLLNNKGAQVGHALVEACGLKWFQELGGDRARSLLYADVLAALTELVVRDPTRRSSL